MRAAAPRCLVGSGVERWLYVVKGNYQAVSVLSVILLSVLCCSLGSLFVFRYFMFLYVLSIDLVRLSVPVQLINWKDMAMK